jgi:hypothetical protein
MAGKWKIMVTLEARVEPYDGRQLRFSNDYELADTRDEALIAFCLWLMSAARERLTGRS